MKFAAGGTPPNKKGRGSYPGELYSEDEVDAILQECSRRAPTGVRDRAIITLMYRAGLRVGEVVGPRGLKPADIDLKQGTLHVKHAKRNKDRVLGVGDGVLAVLQAWLDVRARYAVRRDTPLFCTIQAGKISAMSTDHVRGMMRRRARNAGLAKRAHPHGLRHTYAFQSSIQRKRPVGEIQQALGHAHMATTVIYLNHIAPEAVISTGRADDWQDPAARRKMPSGA